MAEMSIGGETIAGFVRGDVGQWLSTFICTANVNSRQMPRPSPQVGHVSRCLSPTWIASSLTNHTTWPWNHAAVSKGSLQADFIFLFLGSLQWKEDCATGGCLLGLASLPSFLSSSLWPFKSHFSAEVSAGHLVGPLHTVPALRTVGFGLRLRGLCV